MRRTPLKRTKRKGIKFLAISKKLHKKLLSDTRKKYSPKKRKKEKSISQLIKEADRLWSIIVRGLKDNPNGYARCFTCGVKKLRRKMDCGHFCSRRYKAIRWSVDNTRIQCKGCNRYKNGDPITFRENLVAEIGEKRVQAVEAKRNEHVKLTREYLTNLIKSLQ